MITTVGLLLELIGFAFLACDAFKLRSFNEDTSKLDDILIKMVPNNSTLLFGTAIQLNILQNQIAVISGVQQKIESNTATESELAGRNEEIRKIFDYIQTMESPEELHELQKGAQAQARELETLIPRLNAHRKKFIKYAIIGTLLVIAGGILQISAQMLS